MSVLSRICRSLSSTIKTPVNFFSSTAASPSSPSQRQAEMTEVVQFIDNTIASNKIVVFSKSHCPFCHATKQYFATHFPQEKVHVVEIEERSDMRSIQEYLGQKTGESTVPRTFINGESIGGNSDLQRLPKDKVAALVAKLS